MLTQQRLKELLVYNPETGVFRRLVARPNAPAGSVAGSALPTGHLRISVDGQRYFAHRLAWFYVYGCWPNGDLDHRDRRPNHNAIDNLREATTSQNQANVGLRKDNMSGYRGVCYDKSQGNFMGDYILEKCK